MTSLKLKLSLYYITILLGILLIGNFSIPAKAASMFSSRSHTAATRTKSESWVKRGLAIGAGALTGAIVYSVATRDWRWAWGIWGLLTSTTRRIAGVISSGTTTARVVTSTAPGPASRVAQYGVTKVAKRVVKVGAATSIFTWANVQWAQRVFMVSASALTGAVLGNSMYGKY